VSIVLVIQFNTRHDLRFSQKTSSLSTNQMTNRNHPSVTFTLVNSSSTDRQTHPCTLRHLCDCWAAAAERPLITENVNYSIYSTVLS